MTNTGRVFLILLRNITVLGNVIPSYCRKSQVFRLITTSAEQRQHLSAVSAISHNFQFSAQFRTILYSPRNSAYFCFHRIFSHIFPKIALDRIKTKIIVVASWFENGTFSSLKLGHFRFHVLNGIWDVFVPCQLQNLGRFRTSLGMWDVFVLAESGTFSYLPRNVGRFRPC